MTLSTSLLETLFDAQKEAIDFFFQKANLAEIEEVIQRCLSCKGLVIVTGVGKSGIIAEKIAMTLISTGTRALYLPATNLLHGDIGGMEKGDIVLLLSKSGETSELLGLMPHLQKRGSTTVAVVSDPVSSLAKRCQLTVHLPLKKELCPFDLAPTTSTEIQLLFGDLLAISLMERKGFTLEEYAGNHPSGNIGRKITLTVRDIMKSGESLPICSPSDLLVDCLVELTNKRSGCLLVVNEQNHLMGIFTDGDLRRGLQTEGGKIMERKIGELMIEDPIVVPPDILAHRALQMMQDKRYVMMAPVIENQKVVGLIHMHDIVREEG